MKHKVVFEDSPVDLGIKEYLAKQPEWQREDLSDFAAELLKDRKIKHPDANKLDNGKWSLWVRREGEEAVNHICYLMKADEQILSRFEKSLNDPIANGELKNIRKLVIVNQNPGVQTGRADEFFATDSYALGMDSIQRDCFLKVVSEIQNGEPSRNYTQNSDGTIAIHIDRPDVAYGIHIHCVAKWI